MLPVFLIQFEKKLLPVHITAHLTHGLLYIFIVAVRKADHKPQLIQVIDHLHTLGIVLYPVGFLL